MINQVNLKTHQRIEVIVIDTSPLPLISKTEFFDESLHLHPWAYLQED